MASGVGVHASRWLIKENDLNKEDASQLFCSFPDDFSVKFLNDGECHKCMKTVTQK